MAYEPLFFKSDILLASIRGESARHSGESPPEWMHAYRDLGGRTAPARHRQVGNRPPRNPVVYVIHSRKTGMTPPPCFSQLDAHKSQLECRYYPTLDSSAACSRRRSTTCIHAGVDFSLRWNDNKEKTSGLPFRSPPCHT